MNKLYYGALPLLVFSMMSFPQNMIEFQNGEIADADDINNNFDSLDSRISHQESNLRNVRLIESNSDFRQESPYFSEVLSVTCNPDEVIVGSTMSCEGDNFDSGTTNYGAAYVHEFSGRTVLGYCQAPVDTFFSADKWGPGAKIQGQCMSTVNLSNPPPKPPPNEESDGLSINNEDELATELLESMKQEVIRLSEEKAAAHSQ